MKIIDLNDIDKCQYLMIFSYKYKDGIKTSNTTESFLDLNNYVNENEGLVDKKDYLVKNKESLIFLLNKIFSDILLYENIEDEINKVFEDIENKKFHMKNEFFFEFNTDKTHSLLKNYFLTIAELEDNNNDFHSRISKYFDFDENNLNKYYVNNYYQLMNYFIKEIHSGIFMLKYNYYVNSSFHFDNIMILDKLEELCSSSIKNKEYYLSLMKKNRSFCLDVFDFENTNDVIYIRSYIFNISSLSLYRFRFIPHMVNGCKNKRLNTLVENKYKDMNKDLVQIIKSYALYFAKERFTYKDMREDVRYDSEDED